MSCYTQYFSANCNGDFENCWLEWADLHLTPKKQFAVVLTRIIIQSELKYASFHSAVSIERHQTSWTGVSRTTPHSRIFILPSRRSALLRVSSSRPKYARESLWSEVEVLPTSIQVFSQPVQEDTINYTKLRISSLQPPWLLTINVNQCFWSWLDYSM